MGFNCTIEYKMGLQMPYPERRKNEMRTFFRFEVEVEIERIESEISNFFLK